jgi:hypothetical protein
LRMDGLTEQWAYQRKQATNARNTSEARRFSVKPRREA